MWSSVVVLAAAFAVCLGEEGHGSAFAGLRGAVEPRLAASGLRIARIEHELGMLDRGIDQASKVDPRGFIMEMHDHLNDFEDHRCTPNHVQCGWQSSECISNLFVCDGHEDCHNGWDETEDVCSHGPMRAGNVFSGTASWRSCLPLRDHPFRMKITAVATPKIFPSRLIIRARISGDVPALNIHREGDFHGYYVYGQRRLVLVPIKESGGYLHYGLACHFDYGDDKRVDCQLMQELSLHKCADIHLTMEHHDVHHTVHRHGGDHSHDDRDEDHEHHDEKSHFMEHYERNLRGHHVDHHYQDRPGHEISHHGHN